MWDAVYLQSHPCGLTRGTGQPTRAQPMGRALDGPSSTIQGRGEGCEDHGPHIPPPELLGALLDALRRQELHTCKTTTACTNYTGRAPSSLHQAAHTHSLTHTR